MLAASLILLLGVWPSLHCSRDYNVLYFFGMVAAMQHCKFVRLANASPFCNNACESCPKTDESDQPICTESPFQTEFECLCKLRERMCNSSSEQVIFSYCSQSKDDLKNKTLYTFSPSAEIQVFSEPINKDLNIGYHQPTEEASINPTPNKETPASSEPANEAGNKVKWGDIINLISRSHVEMEGTCLRNATKEEIRKKISNIKKQLQNLYVEVACGSFEDITGLFSSEINVTENLDHVDSRRSAEKPNAQCQCDCSTCTSTNTSVKRSGTSSRSNVPGNDSGKSNTIEAGVFKYSPKLPGSTSPSTTGTRPGQQTTGTRPGQPTPATPSSSILPPQSTRNPDDYASPDYEPSREPDYYSSPEYSDYNFPDYSKTLAQYPDYDNPSPDSDYKNSPEQYPSYADSNNGQYRSGAEYSSYE